MTGTILTLRITTRAIGAAALHGAELTLLDGRFLNSRRDRTVPAALRYIRRLLDIVKPSYVVVDAPSRDDPSTIACALVTAILETLRGTTVEVWLMRTTDLLAAFSVSSVVDRREARKLAQILWPDLTHVSRQVQPYVADATAAAVYAECGLATGQTGRTPS